MTAQNPPATGSGIGVEGTPEEVKLVHYKCLESRLEKLISTMTNLIKRLMGEGTE